MAEDVKPDQIAFVCKDCGKMHRGLPAVAFEAPAPYYAIPQDERNKRAKLSSDFCVLDGSGFFVRTVLIIPIKGVSDTFEWGCWSSLSKANFERYWDSFEDLDQSKLGPMFSWLSSHLPQYDMNAPLKTQILPQDNRQRPRIIFNPEESHQLAVDQREGISIDRAIELARPVLHTH